MSTTSFHYVSNGTVSDASDVNQFVDILTGVTGAPGITVNSLTVQSGGLNLQSSSVTVFGAANNLTMAGSSTGNPVTLTSSGSDANVGITITTQGTGVITASDQVALAGGASGLQASSTAATAGLNTAETVLQTFPLIAGVTLKAGSHIRITAQGTNVSSVSGTTTFRLRAGTLGTTGDASVMTWALTSGTLNASDAFTVVIDIAVRTLGSSGTAAGSLAVSQNTAGGILITNLTGVVAATSATFATTTSTFLTFTHVTTATTNTNTFQNVHIDVLS